MARWRWKRSAEILGGLNDLRWLVILVRVGVELRSFVNCRVRLKDDTRCCHWEFKWAGRSVGQWFWTSDGMSSDTDNPYAAPSSGTRANGGFSGRRTALVGVLRITLATVSLLIGLPSFLLGAFYLAAIGWVLATEPITGIRDFMIADCSLLLGLGTAWTIAGWQYWNRQYAIAAIASLVGVVICVIVAAIMAFVRHG